MIEALIILPAHIAHSKALQKKVGKQNKFDAFFEKLNQGSDKLLAKFRDTFYVPFLSFFLKHKFLGFAIPIALFIFSIGAIGGGIVGTSFFPRIASDRVSINLKMPQGTNEKLTDSIISSIENEKKSLVNKILEHKEKSVPNFNEQINELKEYYKTTSLADANIWYENSKKALENDANMLKKEKDAISIEIQKRKTIMDEFSVGENNTPINIENLEGTYSIIGFNQDKSNSGYIGELKLIKTGSNRVNAEWLIDNEQIQNGKGFFKDDILVIYFSYKGKLKEKEKVFKGIVVYKFINNIILNGFWSEKFAHDDFLGFEEGRKLTNSETNILSIK